MRERCKILCTNKNCMFWAGTGKKEYFKKTRNYTPFEDDYYTGLCNKPTIRFVPVFHENKNYSFKFVSCDEGKYVPHNTEPCIECADKSCLWNVAEYCTRENIAVDNTPYGSEDGKELSCRGQSDKKNKGHMDLFRFVNPAGGSHLPDPPGYDDRFWSRKEAEVKEARRQGCPEENLNQIYGREVH